MDRLLLLCVSAVCSMSRLSYAGELKARPHDDVMLSCQVPRGASADLFMWNRADLKSGRYVFFYRDKHSYESYQHPSYKGRVALSDPDLKDCSACIVLKDASVNDTGTYECAGVINGEQELLETISLTVEESGCTAAVRLSWWCFLFMTALTV